MKGTYIGGISQHLKIAFPENWTSQVFKDEAEIENFFAALAEFEAQVLLLFMRSVLSGEYVLRASLLRQRIDSLREAILNCDIPVEELGPSESNIIRLASSLLSHLDYTLKRYKRFIDSINNQYSLSQTQFVLNAYSYKGNPEDQSRFKDIYNVLFAIAEADHRLSYDKKGVKNLIINHSILLKVLGEEDVPQILKPAIEALDGKCLFLLKKLLVYDKSGVDYMLDFEQHHLEVSSINQDWLDTLAERFEFYRNDNTSNNQFGANLDRASYNKQMRVSLFPLLIKFYKDSKNVSLHQLDKIVREFDEVYNRLKDAFSNRAYDKYALNTLRSYMYNSRFVYKLRSADYSFEKLADDLRLIQTVQQETRVADYYPYLRAALYVEREIETETKGECDLNHHQAMLLAMERYIDCASDNFEICKQQSFYPLQSLYNDSLAQFESFGPVFFASSYCRPIQYSNIQLQLDELRNKLLLFKNVRYVLEERNEIEKIKESIDQSKKKDIEIIGAFTAIITFLFGSIDFFSSARVSSYRNQIYNVLSLGIILLLFVSGISLLTMRREKKFSGYLQHPRFWVCTFSVVVFLFLLIYMILITPVA